MPDEILDVINDKDEVIGQEMRSTVHQHGLLHRGVHVFLVTPGRKLIVQQRSIRCHNSPLALDCSLSEHVKSGENYHQAALRGLEEEMGLRDVSLQPLVKFKLIYGPNDYEISLLYEGMADLDAVRFDPLEVEAVTSLSPVDIEAMTGTGEESFTTWFIQLLDWYFGRSSQLEVIEIYPQNRLLIPTVPEKLVPRPAGQGDNGEGW